MNYSHGLLCTLASDEIFILYLHVLGSGSANTFMAIVGPELVR